MRLMLYGAAAVLALTGSAAAGAQARDTAGASAPIIVNGRTKDSEERARSLAKRMSDPVNGQLARFLEPICPIVVGLAEPYAGKVADRIRRVAAEVGAPVAKPRCRANLAIVLVDSGPAFARALASQYPGQFAGVRADERRRLMEEPGPVRSWTVTSVRNEDGQALGNAPETVGQTGYSGGSQIRFGADVPVLRVPEVSIISPLVQQATDLSYVVFETSAVMGKGLMQVAEYAALRGLARTNATRLAAGDDSILATFEPDAAPAPTRLTATDRAYLRGLYHGAGNQTTASRVRRIGRSIVRADESRP